MEMVHCVFTFHELFLMRLSAYFSDDINHNVHSPDALVQNMYGNICSTAAICKGQSDSRSALTYIIMIIPGFIR